MSLASGNHRSALLLLEDPEPDLLGLFLTRSWEWILERNLEEEVGFPHPSLVVLDHGAGGPGRRFCREKILDLRTSGVPIFWLKESDSMHSPETRLYSLAGERQELEELLGPPQSLSYPAPSYVLGELLPGVVHDSCNMLGVVMGFTELLQESKLLKSEDSVALESILRATQRCQELLESVREIGSSRGEELRLTAASVLSQTCLVAKKQLLHQDVDLQFQAGETSSEGIEHSREITLCLLLLVLEIASDLREIKAPGELRLSTGRSAEGQFHFLGSWFPVKEEPRDLPLTGHRWQLARTTAWKIGWSVVRLPRGFRLEKLSLPGSPRL